MGWTDRRAVLFRAAATGLFLLSLTTSAAPRAPGGEPPVTAALGAPPQDFWQPWEPPGAGAPEADEPGPAGDFNWRSWRDAAPACGPASCTWERTFGSASDDKVAAAAELPDGGFIVVGNTRQSRTGRYDAWILRVGNDGALVWHNHFGGPATDQFRDVVVLADGSIVAAGHTRSTGAGESDLWLVKLTPDGVPLFERTHGGPANDKVRAVARGDGDEIFVTGFTASEGAGERDLWVRRFTPDGAPVWSRTLGTARHDEGFDLAVLADGSVAVTGHFWTDPARGYDVAVARLSAGGEMIWQRSLDRAPFEVGTALAPAPDGGLLVTGTTSVEGLRNTDLWAIRLDADGATIWERTYGGARSEEPWEVAAAAAGGFIVAVETFSQGVGGDIWLLRLAPDGAVIWERLFGGALWERPSALLETSDGGLVLGGHTASKGAGFEDGWLLRLTPDGLL